MTRAQAHRVAMAAIALLVLISHAAAAKSCPEPLASTRRLVLVTSDGMSTSAANVQRFEGPTANAPWRAAGGATSVLVGRKGMAWSRAFRALARGHEPIKVNGDKRIPAGVYRIESNFGAAASRLPARA